MGGPVVIFGCYKIRQAHTDAFLQVHRESDNPIVKRLAAFATEIYDHVVEDCVGVLDAEVRGGSWFARTFLVTMHWLKSTEPGLNLGATPRDVSQDIATLEAALRELEATHGGPDPKQWRWGDGLPMSLLPTTPSASTKI